MAKTIVDVPVEVDEDGLAKRGWYAREARARLTSDLWHDLSISVTLELAEKEWTDRYRHDDWLSPVVLEVWHPALGEMAYIDLHVSLRDQLRKKTARIATSGTISYQSGSIDASALKLTLTSFDGGSFQSRIDPLTAADRIIAVDLEDESSCAALLEHELETAAFVTKGGEPNEVVVNVWGATACIADYNQLVDFTSASDQWLTGSETFSIDLPDIEVDLLDGTDFLLGRFTEYHALTLKGRSESDVPRRSAEWLSIVRADVDELSGDVAKVVVRLVDPS